MERDNFQSDFMRFGTNVSLQRSALKLKIGKTIITILARRPRGLRAKINLASKEMSVIFWVCIVRLRLSPTRVNYCYSKRVARVFRVKIYDLQNAIYLDPIL